MDFKKLFGAGVVASLALMAGCGDDSSSAPQESAREPVVDTLYVFSKDTVVLNNVDTLVLNHVDTVVVRDTVVNLDTLILNNKDTVVVRDTLMGLNGESCSAEDTVSNAGVTGYNITCGTKRVGTLWNGKDGQDGLNGSSAYEQAVAAGYVGTEEEWETTIAKRINQDHFVDFRDGHEYRTVKVGDQVWMAENLNYRYLQETEDFDSSSFCLNGLPENCDKYGRLYFYSAAIDSAGVLDDVEYVCGNGLSCEDEMPEMVRGICPEGWHLPDTTEFRQLVNFVDASDNQFKDVAGLKSAYGWIYRETHIAGQKVIYGGNGTDIYGYEAYPAGHGSLDLGATLKYENEGTDGFFWTFNPEVDDPTKAHQVRFTQYYGIFGAMAKSDAASIRCVKDPVKVPGEDDEDEE
ncbi:MULTISPECIES: FISUMP domain-containing protein [unclassified Fibrobacter]|uniref:FISUMP domain-containing protein n=1 Tax=unclassified Fibrobacter TaxID=2634177 RepID=UPI000D6AAA3F|nr:MULTISPECIES: FISUMP domain-containing protein [unclassified Fibrobacter]PWJ70105.1 uncharacterized protein (TIGR02145 family) [Fibrobacter sp. UWR4]PZW73453.1 uncharacterized protein (TIGR02145 family) [Fibrobacter sp. UWR1]